MLTITKKTLNSINKSNYLEADIHLTRQKTFRFLFKMTIHYLFHERHPLHHMNVAHNVRAHTRFSYCQPYQLQK
jgi:ribosomal protein S2